MEQPLCPRRAGSGDPEGKLDWGGRGDGWTSRGFEVAGVVWVGKGCRCWGRPAKGAASKHSPSRWLETGRPTSSELFSPHPLVFRWEAASPPFLSPNSQPQTSWENRGRSSEGRRGMSLLSSP